MDKQNEIINIRKYVSDLIFQVLTEKTNVKDALLNFPVEITDDSIKTAWHAILHYEADEDIRAADSFYAQEQNDYLELIAFILRDGKELPGNIIASYNNYYKETPMPKAKNTKGFLETISRFLNI